jgi:hypothetical protein
MATIDLRQGSGANANHVSRLSGPGPYKVVRVIDLAEATTTKGSALATADVIQVMPVPAYTLLHGAIAEVLTVDSSTGATFDLDVAGGDDFVDGGDLNTLGFVAPGSNGLLPFGANSVNATSAEDAIDMTLIVPGSVVPSDGKVRFTVFMTDVRQVQEAADVDRDQLA